MVKSTRKQLRFAFSMDWVDHYNNTRLAALTRQARTAVCELPTEHLEQLLFYADTFRRGGSFFMDTNKLDLAFIEYAKAVILLHEVLPGRSDFVTKLNDTQRTNIALHLEGVFAHLAAIQSTACGNEDEKLPRSFEYPNLAILAPSQEGSEAVTWVDDNGSGALEMVREESSDKASTKEEESGSPRPASFESELTRVEDIDASRQHDIRVGPRVALVQKISATALLWERDEQKRIEAERTQSGGGGDRDVGYEDHGEGSSNGRVRGWRETIRPTSPPPPSPHWTEIYDASPFSDIERPLSVVSMDTQLTVASPATFKTGAVSMVKSVMSQNSYKTRMNMYYVPPQFRQVASSSSY